MTAAEARAYNRAIDDVLDIAATAVVRIGTEGKRPIPEAFAVAALAELAEAGRALIVPTQQKGPADVR